MDLRQYRRRNRVKASYLMLAQKHDVSEYKIKGKNCSCYFWFPSYIIATKKDIQCK